MTCSKSEPIWDITFTAASGDQLSGTFVGEGVFVPPNTARLTGLSQLKVTIRRRSCADDAGA